MRILAFDPGYERCGAAVIEKVNGCEKLLFSDCIRTKATLPFAERLAEVGWAAAKLLDEWEPQAVALEEVFFEKNKKTAMQVAEVRGVLSYLASSRGLTVHQYKPAEVKIAVTGSGSSDKKAVALMVGRILGLSSTKLGPKKLDDELDAIAVGITCLASVR